MAKKPSPLANMMSKAAAPPFVGGVAAPIPQGPPKKAPPPGGKPSGGKGRGDMANFKGKHAPPFQKKS